MSTGLAGLGFFFGVYMCVCYPQLVLAAACSCDCEAWLLLVAGTNVHGAAAPTASISVSLAHFVASIFSLFLLFSLLLQLHLLVI